MGNTVSSKIRVVKYRAIIANDIVDRFGFFLVDMDANGQPIRADVLGYVGYKIVNQFAEDGKQFVSKILSILQEAEIIHQAAFSAKGPDDMVALVASMHSALYGYETIECNNDPINFDTDEWEGTLYFPRRPVLH